MEQTNDIMHYLLVYYYQYFYYVEQRVTYWSSKVSTNGTVSRYQVIIRHHFSAWEMVNFKC